MKQIWRNATGFLCLTTIFTGGLAFAQPAEVPSKPEDTVSVLRQQIDLLNEKVSKLETAAPSAFPRLQLSGFVDGTFNYNTNSPHPETSVGRVFDKETNTATLNAFKLSIQTVVDETTPFGARADIYAGEDAKVIHSAGLGDANDSFDIEQAYATYRRDGWDLKAGKFVTLAGAEVIESKDNWNVSRGLLFGYAIPFAHTGLRGSYASEDGWDVAAGVNNGWDVANDNNSGKTIELHLGFTGISLPSDSSLNVAWNGYFGPENPDDSSQRSLSDVVVVYKTPWKPLSVMYNFDYANDDGGASWYGHAGYVRYDICDSWALSVRGEYFEDTDGARFGNEGVSRYVEETATVEFRPDTNVITRLEYRLDQSSGDVYFDNDGETKDSQSTIAAEVIVLF